MDEATALDIAFEAIRATLMVSAPIMLVGLIVGLIIAIFQALTQIQEMTLTFVPKIVAVVAVFFLTIGYMTRVALDLFNNFILPMISG